MKPPRPWTLSTKNIMTNPPPLSLRACSWASGVGIVIMLTLSFLLSLADTASAQQQTLVSNLNQTEPNLFGTSPIVNSVFVLDHAQQFTTGSNAQGYKLNSVEIRFAFFTTGFNYTVKIHNNSSGKPGTVVGTLTKPTFDNFSTAKNLTFTASGNGLDLKASTSYFLVLDVTGNSDSGDAGWRITTSTNEDSGAAAGWSIADKHLFRQNTSGADWGDNLIRSTLKIRINGSLVLPTVTIASVTSPVTEGTAARFNVSRTGNNTSALSVNVAVTETTSAGQDFVIASGEGTKTFEIPANSSSAVFSVATTADTTDEPNGTVTVTVNTSNDYKVGDPGSAMVVVNDNDPTPAPSISVNSLRISENSGSSSYTVTLMSQPTHDVTVTVTRGGAQSNAVTTTPATLTFATATWSTAQTVTVTAVDELAIFRDRSMTLSHSATSSDSRYNINDFASLAMEVLDAPHVDAFEPFGFMPKPGNENARRRLPTPMSEFWELRRNTLVDTALDYAVAVSNRPVNNPVTVTATIADFTKAGLSFTRTGTPQQSLTFTFADSEPYVGDCPRGSTEGADGPWWCWRKIWIIKKNTSNTSPDCTRITHTATGGGVRTTTTSQIGMIEARLTPHTWRPPLTFLCPPIATPVPQSSPSNPLNTPGTFPPEAKVLPTAEAQEISNTDEVAVSKALTVSLAAASTSVGEDNGETEFTVMLNRALTTGESATVPFTISGARANRDYRINLQSHRNAPGVSYSKESGKHYLTFTGHSQIATFTLRARPNYDIEQRVITIDFATDDQALHTTGITGGITTLATPIKITIIDDDKAAGPAIWLPDRAASEARGKIRFKIQLNQPAERPVRVCIKTRDTNPVSAQAGHDYTSINIKIRFKPGETLKKVFVDLHDDTERERPEIFELVVTCAHGASVADGLAVATIKDNDDG